jgi:catechol 2,3-dioxygenase-like lactoylglutathione lyase family enzyme
MNHAVLYVRDADRTADFMERLLGFQRLDSVGIMPKINGVAFLRADASNNDHDLALFSVGPDAQDSLAGVGMVGLYHVSWSVNSLRDLVNYGHALEEEGALVGGSDHGTTKALYARDPDGLEFELVWVVPENMLTADDAPTTKDLDIEADIARFGLDTPSRQQQYFA